MPEWPDARMVALLLDVVALLCGALLGTLFYGGLWWTVRHLASARHPARTVFASVLLRMGVALVGLHVVGRGDWLRLLSCLIGFLLARAAVTRLTRLPAAASDAERTGLHHAP